MNFLINAFNTILYRPLFNGLILLYQYLPGHDFGIAVIVLTLLIRLILYPLMGQSIKSQKAMNELQPKIQEIQKTYKKEPEKQAQAMLQVYKTAKINPWASFLPLLIQLPILIALFQVFLTFKEGLSPDYLTMLYSFVPPPNLLKEPTFLGLIDLTRPNFVLAISAGLCQFFQAKVVMPRKTNVKSNQTHSQGENQMAQFTNIMQKQTLYFYPIFSVFVLWNLPAAIGLYWVATSLFSIFQQYLILKKPQKDA